MSKAQVDLYFADKKEMRKDVSGTVLICGNRELWEEREVFKVSTDDDADTHEGLLHYLDTHSLDKYKAVDLDGFHSPLKAIKLLLEKKATLIILGNLKKMTESNMKKYLLKRLNFTDKMITTAPELVTRKSSYKYLCYLNYLGVSKVKVREASDILLVRININASS
jgi:hypothetical protein